MKSALLGCCVAILSAALGSAAAQTQTRTATIYRCGAEGRDLRDSPCPANQKANPTQLEFDHPSVAQTQAARAQAIAEAKRAHEMQTQRRKDEAEARQHASRAVGINGLATAASAPKQAQAPVPPKAPKAPKLAKPHKPAAPAASAPR